MTTNLGDVQNPQEKAYDERYLNIWGREQGYMQARWTITTFFLSVSFTIFGLSLQAKTTSPSVLIAQCIVALAVYWFAYLLNSRLYYYTVFLREYLKTLEDKSKTTLDLQTKIDEKSKQWRVPPTTQLLLLFGLVYTVGAIFIVWFLITQP